MRQKKAAAIISLLFLMTLFFSSGVKPAENPLKLGDIVSSIFGPTETEEFHKELPLKAGGDFSLRNVNGSVTIETWKEEKVDIRAIKSTRHGRERLKEVKIEVTSAPNSVSVDTIYPERKNTHVSVEYEIRIPEGVNLERIITVNGGINIDGPCRDVKALATNGSVDLKKAVGDVSLTSTNGDVNASGIKGKLDARTTNGSVELELTSFEDDVEAETVNGGITLRLGSSEKIDAELKARTVNGKIYVDFPITLKGLTKSKHSFEAQIGQGGALISLRTVNGSIRITD